MTLFVGGIHAVGKTFALTSVCESLGVRHATASQLIKEHRGVSNWGLTRQVDTIDENQRTLIAAIRRLEQGGEKLIVDGHFVLRKAPTVHEKIGIDIFEQLNLQGILLLEAPIGAVADRLRERGDETWTLSEIELFAQRESEQAAAISLALDIPLLTLIRPSIEEVKNALHSLL